MPWNAASKSIGAFRATSNSLSLEMPKKPEKSSKFPLPPNPRKKTRNNELHPPTRMKSQRLFLCEANDPVRGPIRSLITAAGFGEAKNIFFKNHGIQATQITSKK
jgi:hypothetical protein